jgi:MarR family transcriptional regulator, organic hydroperoxide resistance regulator
MIEGGTDVASPWEILADIWQLSQLIVEDSAPELEKLGLHPKAFFLLNSVEQCPFPAELARVMGLPPPTVTYIVKQLEEKRYISRQAEPGDLRKFRLVLTAGGRKAVKTGQEKVNEVFGRRLSRLTSAEIALFEEVVGRLTQAETGMMNNLDKSGIRFC